MHHEQRTRDKISIRQVITRSRSYPLGIGVSQFLDKSLEIENGEDGFELTKEAILELRRASKMFKDAADGLEIKLCQQGTYS